MTLVTMIMKICRENLRMIQVMWLQVCRAMSQKVLQCVPIFRRRCWQERSMLLFHWWKVKRLVTIQPIIRKICIWLTNQYPMTTSDGSYILLRDLIIKAIMLLPKVRSEASKIQDQFTQNTGCFLGMFLQLHLTRFYSGPENLKKSPGQNTREIK